MAKVSLALHLVQILWGLVKILLRQVTRRRSRGRQLLWLEFLWVRGLVCPALAAQLCKDSSSPLAHDVPSRLRARRGRRRSSRRPMRRRQHSLFLLHPTLVKRHRRAGFTRAVRNAEPSMIRIKSIVRIFYILFAKLSHSHPLCQTPPTTRPKSRPTVGPADFLVCVCRASAQAPHGTSCQVYYRECLEQPGSNEQLSECHQDRQGLRASRGRPAFWRYAVRP